MKIHLFNALQVCLRDFEKTGEILHGMTPNLAAIEGLAQKYLAKESHLKPDNLEQFFNESKPHWWIAQYWHLPKSFPPISLPRSFQELNEKNEKFFIDLLLNNIKQIELVSIILRFVRPDYYGILSHPVERVLNVGWGSNATETYQHYLQDLRATQKRYSPFLKRVADADMALWVLHAKYFEKIDDNKQIKNYYENDPFLIRLRTKNLMEPLKWIKYSTLAEGLCDVMPTLSAVVACHILEVTVKDLAKKAGEDWKRVDLRIVIDSLSKKIKLPTDFKRRLHTARDIRNALFHEDELPTKHQIQEIINIIKNIETRFLQ